MICKYCANELKTDAKFCSICGKPVVIEEVKKDIFCSQCGYKLKENSKFCSACGKAMDVAEAETAEAPAAAAVTEAPAVQAVPVAQAPAAEPVPAVQPVPTVVVPQPTVYQPQAAPAKDTAGLQNKVLIFGIIALAAALSSGLSILGIIFGIIAMSKAKEYVNYMGERPGRVSLGRGLGKAGLIVGIAMTVFWIFYIVIMVYLGVQNGGSMDFYYSF